MPILNRGTHTWDAMFPDACVVTVKKKSATAQTVTCLVTNFDDSGGGQDTESVAHFGGCFVTVTKPREEFEVSFDADINDTIWAQLMSNSITQQAGSPLSGSFMMVKSDGDQDPLKIKLEWINGSDAYKILYYNARVTGYEKSSAADDRLTATVSFKLSPTNTVGSAQKIEMETSNTYDTLIGSTATGSYGSFELVFDTLFGF